MYIVSDVDSNNSYLPSLKISDKCNAWRGNSIIEKFGHPRIEYSDKRFWSEIRHPIWCPTRRKIGCLTDPEIPYSKHPCLSHPKVQDFKNVIIRMIHLPEGLKNGGSNSSVGCYVYCTAIDRLGNSLTITQKCQHSSSRRRPTSCCSSCSGHLQPHRSTSMSASVTVWRRGKTDSYISSGILTTWLPA